MRLRSEVTCPSFWEKSVRWINPSSIWSEAVQASEVRSQIIVALRLAHFSSHVFFHPLPSFTPKMYQTSFSSSNIPSELFVSLLPPLLPSISLSGSHSQVSDKIPLPQGICLPTSQHHPQILLGGPTQCSQSYLAFPCNRVDHTA